MKPTTEILARISQNSLANKEEVFTKLYRYLLRPDIYFVAYKNLYANNGAATKGVNEDTADGFSEAKIDSIIKALADETYQPMPVRRTYIQKKNALKSPQRSQRYKWNRASQIFHPAHRVLLRQTAALQKAPRGG